MYNNNINAYQNSKFKYNVKLIELCQNLLRIYYIIFTSVLLQKKGAFRYLFEKNVYRNY